MALTRDRIVDAAAGLLAEYGLADLSMRRVAARLEVQPGALYNHVPSKQQLLAALADRILDGVAQPCGPWREAVGHWAASLRDCLLAHRDSADLVATARGFRLSRRDVTRNPAEALATAGMDPADARAAAVTLLHFVIGHVAEEQARAEWERFGGAPGGGAVADGTTFGIGLDLLLAGLATRLP